MAGRASQPVVKAKPAGQRAPNVHKRYSDADTPLCSVNVELKAGVCQTIPVPEAVHGAELFVVNGFARNYYIFTGWIDFPKTLTLPTDDSPLRYDVEKHPTFAFLRHQKVIMVADRDMAGFLDFYGPDTSD